MTGIKLTTIVKLLTNFEIDQPFCLDVLLNLDFKDTGAKEVVLSLSECLPADKFAVHRVMFVCACKRHAPPDHRPDDVDKPCESPWGGTGRVGLVIVTLVDNVYCTYHLELY